MTTNPSATIPLPCPKCAGEMATYERSGIHIDRCRECRGVFLDRGELERLIDLEAVAMEAAGRGARLGAGAPAGAGMPTDPTPVPSAGPSPASWADPWDPRYGQGDPRQGRYRGPDVDDDDDRWDGRGGDRYRDDPYRGGDDRGRSRKRSLLGELFEGFGD